MSNIIGSGGTGDPPHMRGREAERILKEAGVHPNVRRVIVGIADYNSYLEQRVAQMERDMQHVMNVASTMSDAGEQLMNESQQLRQYLSGGSGVSSGSESSNSDD